MTLLKNEVGLEVAAVQLLEGVKIARLAELVLERLAAAVSATAPPAAAQIPPPMPVSEPDPTSEPEPIAANGRPDYAALDYVRW